MSNLTENIGNNHLNVVINFHKNDQFSARSFFELLLSVDEGIKTHYYLQYGDSESTIEIGETLCNFLDRKEAVLSTTLPPVTVPQDFVASDPNTEVYPGNHTRKTVEEKWRIFQWNLGIYKYINQLDHFLSLEPDCLVLKQKWAAPLRNALGEYRQPFIGHLKKGLINGQMVPTHFAGSSLYNCLMLRELQLDKYFYERYENPWWKLRNQPDTTTAGNAFLGPVISGYDVSYDYFLFALYMRHLTGSNDPKDWSSVSLHSHEDLVYCDFRSQITIDQLFDRYYGKLSVLHGVKDDAARHAVIRAMRSKHLADSPAYPIGGSFEAFPIARDRRVDQPTQRYSKLNIIRPDNSGLLSIVDLRNQFVGKRCFIIGNGPSLKETDLTLLKDEFTFGLNRIYLNYSVMGFEPTFYCCVNPNVIEQFACEIDRLNSVKFVTDRALGFLKNHWNTFFLKSIPSIGFHEDISDLQWYEGWTVTYCAMQVAFHLGFQEVVLVGVDHYFKDSGTPNKAVESGGEDVNHFHPNYFGKGIVWQYPDLARSEQSYTRAQKVYQANDRYIIDATIGGHLRIFPKASYHQVVSCEKRYLDLVKALKQKQPLVSIITPAHNAADTILTTIRSIQEQDYQNWELIVINDLSEDSTAVVVEAIAQEDPRIRLLNSDGIGTSAARNTGLNVALGEYITFLDADDILYEKSLSTRVDALHYKSGVSIVSCITHMVDDDFSQLGVSIRANKKLFGFSDISANLHPNSLMGRADVMKSVQFDSEHDGVEDWVYLSRLLRCGHVVHEVDNCAVAYRIRNHSVVMADFNAHEERCLKVLDLIYSHDPKCSAAKSEFEDGLSDGRKPAILAKRQIALLVNLLLNRQGRQIMRLLAEMDLAKANAVSDKDILSAIRFVTMRTLACNDSTWQDKLANQFRDKIVSLCEKGGISNKLPFFTYVLYRTCKVFQQDYLPYSGISLFGNFERSFHAHFDETYFIAEIFNYRGSKSVVDLVMIDIGAHHGGSLSSFAKTGWTVYAFEPDPKNRQALLKNLEDSQLVTVDARAVSDRAGEILPFFTSEESTGISGLSAFRDSHQESCQVVTTTVKDICTEHQLSHVDFLKIDTEGFDLMVLKGVPWEHLQPDVIECEFENRKTIPLGYTFNDIAQYLVERGYSVFVSEWHPVIRYGIKHDWFRLIPYPCELASPDSWGNLIAFKHPPDIGLLASTAQRLVKTQATTTTVSSEKQSSLIKQSLAQDAKTIKDKKPVLSQSEHTEHNSLQLNKAQPQQSDSDSVSVQNGQIAQSKQQVLAVDIHQPMFKSPFPNKFQLGVRLLKRIARYYKSWPLVLAALTVSLNSAAMLDDIPFRWAFMGGGTALMLFLIGHSASKADFSIKVAEEAQLSVGYTKDDVSALEEKIAEMKSKGRTAFNRGTRAIRQSKENLTTLSQLRKQANDLAAKTSQAVSHSTQALSLANQAINDATLAKERTKQSETVVKVNVEQVTQKVEQCLASVVQATETANQATETANQATETANQATETANQATETANQATETANQATETANQATETANQATEIANQATETANRSISEFGTLDNALSTASYALDQVNCMATHFNLPTITFGKVVKNLPNLEKILFYFGHHKCATNWIRPILREVCQLKRWSYQVEGGVNNPLVYQRSEVLIYCNVSANFNCLPLMLGSCQSTKGFHLIRDPRDVLVSQYWSWRNTHGINDSEILAFRRRSLSMSVEDGLLDLMSNIRMVKQLTNWPFGQLNNVLEIKYEDLIEAPQFHICKIFDHLEIEIDATLLTKAMKNNSFETRSRRSLGEENRNSHLRNGMAGDWKNYFTDNLKDAFKEQHGGLLIYLGYEKDLNW